MNFWLKVLRFIIIYILSLPTMVIAKPMHWVFDFITISHPDLFRPRNTPANHGKKVQKVQEQVQEWNRSGRKKRMCTARPTWQTLSVRNLNKSKYTQISIDLKDIIKIDKENMILHVEPGMKMGTLTHRLLSQGLTIPIIPEFESLTIGGCINGTGIETSSHKYGLFADACLEFELVMSDGKIVTCSKDFNSDLFYAISWSHGTIGFLTAVKIQLLPAPRYVKVEYHPTDSLETAQALLEKSEGYDFIEGIMFGLNKIVVMHGTMTDQPEKSQVNSINRWYKPWFYKHVESKLDDKSSTVEFIPARDYYHRHQRAYFWEVAISCPMGNFFLFRYLFGWVYPQSFQFTKLVFSESTWDLIWTKRHVLQDFMIPMSKLSEAIHFAHKEVEVYPIWLCPCKYFQNPGLAHLPSGIDEMYIDVGIYGIAPKKGDYDPEKKIRAMEQFVTELKGYQFLYADTYMTRDEFRNMFDMEHYEKVRKAYKCEDAFPEVYDKISRNARK